MPSFLAHFLFIGRTKLNPSQVLVGSFALIVALGTLLLSLPQASSKETAIPIIDALFMATSAVCVTGLSVLNVGADLSLFGQIVLLALIQIGGLGFMTFATLAFIMVGRKMGFHNRLLLKESYNQLSFEGIFQLSKQIIKLTIAIELIGGLLLAVLLWPQFELKALYFGLWHAVSAFCNAGLDLFGGDSLVVINQQKSPILIIFMTLTVLGGLGFIVLEDLRNWRKLKKISFHSRIVLLMTTLLLVMGTVMFYMMERDAILAQSFTSEREKVLHSAFMTTSQTAGFSTVNIGSLQEKSAFFSIWLMFIGASPASVGGGIKTTTVFVLALALWAYLKHQPGVFVFSRQITKGTIERATMVFVLALLFISGMTLLLMTTEKQAFLPLLFEVTSAFSTVGLSMGVTAQLSELGKLLVIIAMFAGRIGLLTVLFAVIKPKKGVSLEYPVARVVVG